MIMGTVKLSGKRERFVPFPWEEVSAGGTVYGWEPAEWLPMGRMVDINRLVDKTVGALASGISTMEYAIPFFYDNENGSNEKTLLHGGFVQFI
jgi:hypothetical protein